MRDTMARAIAALLTAGAMGIAPNANSQTTSQSDGQSTNLEEIVVTAQRRSEKIKDIPFTMAAKSGEDLQREGVTTTRDLTAAFPGLNFTSQSAYVEPSIRGISTSVSGPGAEGPVAIYVDGLYQPSQVGNLFDLPDIERIEVLKGPQGTLYGRNATGGAILISTRDPSFKPTGSVTIGDGVFFGGSAKTSNDVQAQAFVSGPLIADKLAGSLSAAEQYVPGFMTDDLDGNRYGKIQSWLVRTKLLFLPFDGLRFLLSSSYADRLDDTSESVIPLNGVSVGAAYPGAVVPTRPWHTASELGGGGSYVRTKHADGALKIDWTVAGLGTVTSRTGYTNLRMLLDADIDGTYSPNCLAAIFICATPYVAGQPDVTYQQDLNFASEKFGRFSFVAGALYYHNKETGFYNINPPITSTPVDVYGPYGYFIFDGYVTTKAHAIFIEGTYDITDALTAIAGVRYSSETHDGMARESVFTFAYPTGPFTALPPGGAPTDKAFTPRVALRYAINDSTNLYATYNQGFKSGVLTALSLTAPASRPEKIDSFEVGIKQSTGPFSFDASAFYYNYKDLQVQFFNGLTTYVRNAAAAKSYGFDLDGAVLLADGFTLRAAASWIPYAKYKTFPNGIDYALPVGLGGLQQVTIDATGQRLLKDPTFTGSVTADYTHALPSGSLNASATVFHSSPYDWDLLRRVQTLQYTTIDGQLSIAPRESRFKYTLYGKNLTNKAYIVGATLSSEADGVNFAQPREVGLRLNYSW